MCFTCVGVWMSVCMSLCCHICCYQGNPVGRQRSAERCTAWRRETCGAQPVAGKKPVRDSPTNPVRFPCPWDELFFTQSDSMVDSSTEEMRGDFFLIELSVLLSSPSLFLISKHKKKMKLVGKNKQQTNKKTYKEKKKRYAGLQTFSKTETFSLCWWIMGKKRNV